MKKTLLLLSSLLFCAAHGMQEPQKPAGVQQSESNKRIQVFIGDDFIVIPVKSSATMQDVKQYIVDQGISVTEQQQLYPLRGAFLRRLKVRDVAESANVYQIMEEYATTGFVIE